MGSPREPGHRANPFGGDTKGDLIAELKLSHTIGGVSKLRSEQAKAQEELEKEQYRKFLAKFTAENFLKKIPEKDPAGNEIPRWKREMLAKKVRLHESKCNLAKKVNQNVSPLLKPYQKCGRTKYIIITYHYFIKWPKR